MGSDDGITRSAMLLLTLGEDSLLLAVMEAGLELILGRIRPIVYADLPSDHKLQQMICAHVIGVTQNTAVGAAMVFEIRSLLDVKSPPATASTADHQSYAEFLERRSAFFTARDEFEHLFRQVIREGVQNGTFRPVDDGIFTNTLLGAHNWVGIWYKPSGRLSGDEIAAIVLIVFGIVSFLSLLNVSADATISTAWSNTLKSLFGYGSVIVSAGILGLGIVILLPKMGRVIKFPTRRILALEVAFLSLLALLHLAANDPEMRAMARAGEGGNPGRRRAPC